MNFTMKLIENETGAPVPGVPDFQTDGGIMICRVERDGKLGWVTCGVNMGEVLGEAGSEMALAKALMSAAKEATKTGGETMASFMAALSYEFIQLSKTVLPPKEAAQFLLLMAEEAAKMACNEMEMPV